MIYLNNKTETLWDIGGNCLDLINPEAINSPYYFLKQHGVVYIDSSNTQIKE